MKVSRLSWNAGTTVNQAGRTGSKKAYFPISLPGKASSDRQLGNLESMEVWKCGSVESNIFFPQILLFKKRISPIADFLSDPKV